MNPSVLSTDPKKTTREETPLRVKVLARVSNLLHDSTQATPPLASLFTIVSCGLSTVASGSIHFVHCCRCRAGYPSARGAPRRGASPPKWAGSGGFLVNIGQPATPTPTPAAPFRFPLRHSQSLATHVLTTQWCYTIAAPRNSRI